MRPALRPHRRAPDPTDPSRRQFLGVLGAAAAGAIARPLAAEAHGRRAPDGLTGREIVIAARGWTGRTVVQPDYERTLARVVLSVPAATPREPGGTVEDGPQNPVPIAFLRDVYGPLLSVLPAYTALDVVTSEADRLRVARLLGPLAAGRELTIHSLDDPSVEPDLWAQDLGEAFSVDGAARFLVSMPAAEADAYNSRITHSREVMAKAIFGRDAVTRADFVFEGGNLSADRTDQGLRVFIGYNDLMLTVRAYDAQGRSLSIRRAAEKVSAWLGGAEVVVIGTDTQSRFLPHIDQAFTFLAGRKAVVNVLDGGPSDERRQLAQYRAQLESLGYEVIALANTVEDIRHFRTSTNAVPFVNRTTGQRTIIFPVFPGEVRPGAGGTITGADLVGKGRAAFDAFSEAGYVPVPIPDVSHIAGGNTHCLTNVVA